jgi:hypothetical protein
MSEEKTIDEKIKEKSTRIKRERIVEFYTTYTQLCHDRSAYDISSCAQIYKIMMMMKEESTDDETFKKCETALDMFLNMANKNKVLTMKDCFDIASAKDDLILELEKL